MANESKLIQIIGMLSKELESEHDDKSCEKEVGDEWVKQLREKRYQVAERNGEIQKLHCEMGAKNTTINRQNDVIAVLKEGIDKLKADNEVLSKEHVIQGDALWSIGNLCVETKTSDADMDIAERVEWLASAYSEEKSEKGKLMELLADRHKRTFVVATGILEEFKEWLAERGKK